MAVRELFLGRRAHVDDLDLERQRLARERMIEIEVDVEVADLDDARLPAALARVHDDHLPDDERAACVARCFSGTRCTAFSLRSP